MEHACARFNASLVDFYLPASSESRGATDSTCDYLLIQKKSHFQKKKKNAHARMLRFATSSKTSAVTRFSNYNTSARTTREERPSTFDGRASMAKSVTAAFVTALCLAGTNAAYVHGDPAGVAHPGCIRSDPRLVSHGIPSANQSCPGAPMTDVWDFERDLYPFNLERARDEFDAFWPANNLVASNDFNVPTFEDYREPGDPPLRKEEVTRATGRSTGSTSSLGKRRRRVSPRITSTRTSR